LKEKGRSALEAMGNKLIVNGCFSEKEKLCFGSKLVRIDKKRNSMEVG